MPVAHRGRVVEGMEQDRRSQVVGQVADQADRRHGCPRAEVELPHCGVGRGGYPGPTVNSEVTSQNACSITLRRPYTWLPGPAAARSTTSFCSMKCMSRTAAAWSRAWNRIGEDRL